MSSVFSHFLKVDKILELTFFRQEKTSKDSKRCVSIYCTWVSWLMDCLQLPLIRVEEAVSWTQRFVTRKISPKNRINLWQTNSKQMFADISNYVSSKQDKECYIKTTSCLEELSRHFCQHFMRRTTQQTFSVINLASQQKITKLFFSSQVKPLRCCLQSDKLLNCHVWKFYKDLFLNCRVSSWPDLSIKSYFLMVSSLILLRSLRVCILKQLFFLNLGK